VCVCPRTGLLHGSQCTRQCQILEPGVNTTGGRFTIPDLTAFVALVSFSPLSRSIHVVLLPCIAGAHEVTKHVAIGNHPGSGECLTRRRRKGGFRWLVPGIEAQKEVTSWGNNWMVELSLNL
jgi:hypothetical protein